jgi:formylglycine-generating enzyme required for sulfatase activity
MAMRLMIEAALAAATALTAVLGPVLQHPETRAAPALPTVVVAPGTFAFRLPGEYLKDGWPVDAPERTVTFQRGFEIMKDEVSSADYAACVADGACKAAESGTASAALPVTGVSYRDAVTYAVWLSAKTGENWRLPTDEEWSFAAAERLHDDSLSLPQEAGNPAARWLARYRAEAAADKRDTQPKPLGSFGTNSKGLADISGNVWEWTATCYTRAAVGNDGQVAHHTENCGVRVVAGRHRGYMSTFIRDGRSGGCAAGLAPDNLGFRLVREKLSLVGRIRLQWADVVQGWFG